MANEKINYVLEVDEKGAITSIKKLEKQTNRSTGKMKKNFKGTSKSVKSVTKAVSGLTAAYLSLNSAIRIGSYIIRTGASFEQIKIQLKTITGSAEAAEKAFAWISNFAKTTPYELEQVATAFSRLKSYGMDATQYLEVLGDTASAMGKDIMQGVEMFADAAQGEFERLKEFGIRASQAGDQVTFSWQENGQLMTKTVKKNAESISTALAQILSKFAGAMKDQSKTLVGIWSNLKDTFTQTANTLFESGAGDVIKENLKNINEEISEWIKQNDEMLKQDTAEFFKSVGAGIKTVGIAINGVWTVWKSIPEPLRKLMIGGPGLGLIRMGIEKSEVSRQLEEHARKKNLEQDLFNAIYGKDGKADLSVIGIGIEPLQIPDIIAPKKPNLSTLNAGMDQNALIESVLRERLELQGKHQEAEKAEVQAHYATLYKTHSKNSDLILQLKINEAMEIANIDNKYNQIELEKEKELREAELEIAKETERQILEVEKEAYEARMAMQKELSQTFSSMFTDATFDFIDGTKSMGEAFEDFALDYLRWVVKMDMQNRLFKASMSGGGGAGGLLSGIFGMVGGLFAGGGGGAGSAAGGGPASIPMITNTSYADGGIARGPQLAMVGDNQAQREAIVPLGRSGGIPVEFRGGGGSQIINYNVNINAMDSQSFLDFSRRNPQVYSQMLKESINRGDSGTLSAIRSAAR